MAGALQTTFSNHILERKFSCFDDFIKFVTTG